MANKKLQLTNAYDSSKGQAHSEEMGSEQFQIIKVTDPQDPRVSQYYEAFSEIFTLPEIRRSEEGIREWLKTNSNDVMQAKNGPTEHAIMMVVDTHQNDRVVGGWDGVKFTADGLTYDETNGYLGGAQGTYVWVADGYRAKDGFNGKEGALGPNFFTHLRDAAVKDTEAWVSQKTGQDALGRTYTFFEQEDVTRLTPQERAEDMNASGLDPVQRLEVFMDKLGAKIVQDPNGGGWYAQTAYPEVGQQEIEQSGAADYLLLTGLFPNGRQPTSALMAHGINRVAGVLATDGGRFNINDHEVIQRMNAHLSDNRLMELGTLRPELIKLKAQTVEHVRRNGHAEAGETFGQILNLPAIDGPGFSRTIVHAFDAKMDAGMAGISKPEYDA